jgi:hypothetical protein
MADDVKAGESKQGFGSKLPDKSTNQHVSAAARMTEASKGSITEAPDSKVTDAIRDESQARQDASDAAQKAAPTGKDIPELAAENIRGDQTAISKPHQPKDLASLKASGAQLEPALIAKDGGSVPHGFVPSPAGPVPASSVGNAAEALAKHGETLKREAAGDDVTEEQLSRMNKHEIRSVAHDRGYKIGEGSQRSLSARFLDAQAKSKSDREKKLDAVKG